MEEKRKIQQSSNDFEMSSLFVPLPRMNNFQLGGYGPPEKNPEKNPRYKTEICRNFKGQLISKCPYENQFHPKYQRKYFWISALKFFVAFLGLPGTGYLISKCSILNGSEG